MLQFICNNRDSTSTIRQYYISISCYGRVGFVYLFCISLRDNNIDHPYYYSIMDMNLSYYRKI